MSMLAEHGELERTHLASVAQRSRTSSDPSPLPVATHPFKRLLDVVIAGFSLLLFLPLLAVVMAAIR
ncbi:MAG: hypothetical protein ACXU8S_13020, partial [Phenylobacterium sp.]